MKTFPVTANFMVRHIVLSEIEEVQISQPMLVRGGQYQCIVGLKSGTRINITKEEAQALLKMLEGENVNG